MSRKVRTTWAKRLAHRQVQSARRAARAGRYSAALEAMDVALLLDPTAYSHDYQGVLLSLTGNNEAALESFARALSLSAGSQERARISFHRGLAHARQLAYDQALLDLKRAALLDPADATYREAVSQVQREMQGAGRQA